jgi:hypothetical protein
MTGKRRPAPGSTVEGPGIGKCEQENPSRGQQRDELETSPILTGSALSVLPLRTAPVAPTNGEINGTMTPNSVSVSGAKGLRAPYHC